MVIPNFLMTIFERKISLKQLVERLDKVEHKSAIQLITRILIENCSHVRGRQVDLIVNISEDKIYIGFFLSKSHFPAFDMNSLGGPMLYFNAKIISQHLPNNNKMKNIFQIRLKNYKILHSKYESVELVDPRIIETISKLEIEEIQN